MDENDDQIALRKWMTAGLAIEEVVALKGDAGYLLSNMIAKYTLAADSYRLSEGAWKELRSREVDLNERYARRRFYGKASGFIYEHCVPASLVRTHLLEGDKSLETVTRVLEQSGFVAVLLREENALLRSAGLDSKMPEGWGFGDDVTARYDAVEIVLREHDVLRVKGKIMR